MLSQKPTQATIAKNLGLSQQTVSFALNGYDKIPEKTRSRVLEEAARIGYRLNSAAKLFRSGRMGAIALITHRNFHTVPNLVLSGLNKVLLNREVHLTLYGAKLEDFTDPDNPPRLLRENFVDGIIAMDNGHWTEELDQWIQRFNIPTIWLNRKGSHNCVYPDEVYLAEKLTREVLAQHPGDLIYSTPEVTAQAHYSVPDRLEGVRRAAKKAKRKLTIQYQNKTLYLQNPSAIGSHIHELLRNYPKPACLVTYGLEDAQAYYLQARLLGWRIPEDLGIACFTDQRALLAHIPITHLTIPLGPCAKAAVPLLEKRIVRGYKKVTSQAVRLFDFAPESTI